MFGISAWRGRSRGLAPRSGARRWLLPWLLPGMLLSCRPDQKPSQAKAAQHEAAATAAQAAPQGAPPPPLGVGSLDELAWRRRGGQAAFRRARVAEHRGDWPTMVSACQAALRADPSHLEASWLLAAGLAHLGQLAGVAAPLARALAGDPGKWAVPALQLSFFAPFWASAEGRAVRAWVDGLLVRWPQVLARSLVLLHRGRLVAYDLTERRWFPLSRHARVLGALAHPPQLAYVAAPPAGRKELVLGRIDLRSGSLEEVPLPVGDTLQVVAMAHDAPFLARVGQGAWLQLVDGELRETKARPPRTLVPRLTLRGGQASLERQPVAGVIADWDQGALASAMRIHRSHRIVTAPAPALIDGQRVVWSPSGAHLAFVTGVEPCDAATAAERRYVAYVADPITGAVVELAHAAAGLELAWVDDDQVAAASERGVELLSLTGAPPQLLAAEVSLPVPLRISRCATEVPEASAAPEDLDDL